MSKRVILTLLSGNFTNGFPAILRIRTDNSIEEEKEYRGQLPPAPEIVALFDDWQQAFLEKLKTAKNRGKSRLKVLETKQFSSKKAAKKLEARFNLWLDSGDSWQKIRDNLFHNLSFKDDIRLIIQTEDRILSKLPWHSWQAFFDRYQNAELAIAENTYETVKIPPSKRKKVRILSVLGDSEDINVNADRKYLDSLQKLNAETVFLVEPQYREFERAIWDSNGWDILFFAGHSSSEARIGRICLNEKESIEISELKYALQRAISQGLQIAIFNSCDGLGIASSLVELNIPQIIVMRYPVPDGVAQEFLLNFLQAFTAGKSLYASVREAREKLQGLEAEIPCASWIPIIYQNPVVIPKTWRKLGGWYSLATENLFISQHRPDYQKLRGLLLTGNWREADLITRSIILQISDREHEGWLDSRAIATFPASDLRMLDHLWLKYSNGRFGFSIQKQIWSQVVQNTIAFGDCVGWRGDRTWLLYYSDFQFSLNAPQGHLPSWGKWCSGWRLWRDMWSQDFGSLGKVMEWVYLPGHYASSLILSDAKWSNLIKEEDNKKESAISLFAKLDT